MEDSKIMDKIYSTSLDRASLSLEEPKRSGAYGDGSETDYLLGEKKKKFVVKPAILYTLLLSHFLYKWNCRMWEYAVSIYLVTIDCNSLLLPAVYGFVRAFTVVCLGTLVGDWVDANRRLKVVRTTLLIENGTIALSAGSLIIVLLPQLGMTSASDSESYHPITNNWVYYTCAVSLIVLSSTATLATTGTMVAIERDWVVVITHRNEEALAGINSKLQQIDLFCKIAAPIPVSLIMSVSLWGSALMVVVFSVVGFFVEYGLLSRVHRLVPQLGVKKRREDWEKSVDVDGTRKTSSSNDVDVDAEPEVVIKEKRGFFTKLGGSCITLARGWKTFYAQAAFLSGMAMALTYMTILAFGGLFNAYLVTQGMKYWQISLYQGIAAGLAIFGTGLYPSVRRRIGLTRTGMLAMSIQVVCLLLCAASVFMPGSSRAKHLHYSSSCRVQNLTMCIETNVTTTMLPTLNVTTPMPLVNGSVMPPIVNATIIIECTNFPENQTTHHHKVNSDPYTPSLIALIVGLMPSRIGLWMFNCAVTQIYQETVPIKDRGVVGGVQWVLNYAFDMTRCALVTAFPQPGQFGYLILASVSVTVVAYMFYAGYLKKEQGHLCPCHGKRVVVDSEEEPESGVDVTN